MRSWWQHHTENMWKCLPSLIRHWSRFLRYRRMTQAAQDPWSAQGHPVTAPGAPARFVPSSSNGIGRPAAPPPFALNRPQTWNTAAMETPAPSHPLRSPIGSPLHAAQGPNNPLPHQLQIPHGAQYMGNQKKMDGPTNYLKMFPGNPVDFKHRSERFVDHMVKAHVMWRSTLTWMGRTNEDLSFARLKNRKPLVRTMRME